MTMSEQPAWLAELSEAWPDQQQQPASIGRQQTTSIQQQQMDFGSLVIRDQHGHGSSVDGRTSPALSSTSSVGGSPALGTFVMRQVTDGSLQVKPAASTTAAGKNGDAAAVNQLAWAVSAFGGLLEAPKTPNRLQALFMVPSRTSPVAVTAQETPLETSPSAVPLPVTPNSPDLADSPIQMTPSQQQHQGKSTPIQRDSPQPSTPHLIVHDAPKLTPGPSPASFQSVQAAELSTIAEEPEPETDQTSEAGDEQVADEAVVIQRDVSTGGSVQPVGTGAMPTSDFSFQVAKAKRDSWRSLLPPPTPPPNAATEAYRTSTPTTLATKTALKASVAQTAASDLPEMTMALTPQPSSKSADMGIFKFHHDATTRQHLEALVKEVDGLCSPPEATLAQPSRDLDASWVAQLRQMRASQAAMHRHQSPAFSSPMRPFSALPGGSDSFDENGHLIDSRSAKRVRLSMSDWRTSPRPQAILSPIRSMRNTRRPFQSLPRKVFSQSAAVRASTTPVRPPLRSLAHSAQVGQRAWTNAPVTPASPQYQPTSANRRGSESYFPAQEPNSTAAQAILNRVDEARALMHQIRQRQASQESQRSAASSQDKRKAPAVALQQHLSVPRVTHHGRVPSYSSKASSQHSRSSNSARAVSISTAATSLVASGHSQPHPRPAQEPLLRHEEAVHGSQFQQTAMSSTPLSSPLLSPAIIPAADGQDDPFNDASTVDASRSARPAGHARKPSQSKISGLQLSTGATSDRTSTPPLSTALPLPSPNLPEIQSASVNVAKPIVDTPAVKPVRSALKRADSFCTPLSNARSVMEDQGRFGRSVSFNETRTLHKAPLLERSKTAPPTSGLRHVAYTSEDAARAQQEAIAAESDEDSTNPLASSTQISSNATAAHADSTDEQDTPTSNLTNLRHRRNKRSSRSSLANASISTLAWHWKPLPANTTIMTECSFGISHDKLVQVLTDIAPMEPDWKNLRKIDLSNRDVDSLIRLKEFCPKLDHGIFTRNKLSFLTGIAATIRFLDVSHNKLNDVTAFAHIPNLETLDVSHNIEISELRQLACLKHLRVLHANSCAVVDLAGVGELDGLVEVHLSGNQLATVDLSATSWQRLETLDLSNNGIKTLKGISSLSSCKVLDLDHNLLDVLTLDQPLPSLRILKVSHNKIAKLDLAHLRHIRTVFADSNRLSEVTGTTKLLHLENLSIRDQRQKRISIDWHSLRDLRRLYISNNAVPPHFPPEPFLNLSLLEMAGCKLTTLPAGFGENLPNVRVLNLDNNFLDDLAPLVGMSRLTRLTVQGGRVEQLKSALAILHSMPELELLDLRNNPVSLGFYAMPTARTPEGGFSAQDKHFRASLPDEWLAKRSVYRSLLLSALPQLIVLDGLKVSKKHRIRARTLLDTFANTLI